jgi:glycosyltransferase involved in cell wall biosynthesis
VPAAYGGFETAVEEIGQRLVAEGHEVTVYCRGSQDKPTSHLGMRLVHLPAAHKKALETLSHTFLSVMHLLISRRRYDVAFVFNAANAVFLPVLRLRRLPVAVHVDGLEWKRTKWGTWGRRYYRLAESLSVRWADALIADAQGISDYYTAEFGVATELIRYGAPIQADPASDKLSELELRPQEFHVAVARFEPENHVLEIVQGYRGSAASRPLVVVGSAPYADDYTAAIIAAAGDDPRIRLVGGVWDQDLLDQLYANAATYLHGHSVGGTNPSLLRAMGAGTPVIAFDASFNREVLGGMGWYFSTPEGVAAAVEQAEDNTASTLAIGSSLQAVASTRFDWRDVSQGYADLAANLISGASQRGKASGRRQS